MLLLHHEGFSTRGCHNTVWLQWFPEIFLVQLHPQWQPGSWMCSCLHKFFQVLLPHCQWKRVLASDLCFLGCCVNVLLLFLVSALVIKSCSIKSGRMRGSLVTLQKLVQLFPSETSFKNDLGVGYLLIGDNSNAKKVYEEVSFHSSQGKLMFAFLY